MSGVRITGLSEAAVREIAAAVGMPAQNGEAFLRHLRATAALLKVSAANADNRGSTAGVLAVIAKGMEEVAAALCEPPAAPGADVWRIDPADATNVIDGHGELVASCADEAAARQIVSARAGAS